MIQSGITTKLNNNTNTALPNMSQTIMSWFLDVTFEVIEREIPDDSADFVETVVQAIKTRGVVQPPSPKDLKIMPEGAWAWEWLTVHCLPNVKLNTNQFIKYDGKLYKVMAYKDWSKYGYIKYTLLEAFRAEQEGL